MATKIPTYASDGRRLRPYSLHAIEHLLSLSLVVARRNRKGTIVCAHFRPTDGSNPLRAIANMGQRYSFLERVGDRRVWAHTPLIGRQDIEQERDKSPAELDRYIRDIFRAVPLSCLGKPKPKPKVVNIADFQRKRTAGAKPERKAA